MNNDAKLKKDTRNWIDYAYLDLNNPKIEAGTTMADGYICYLIDSLIQLENKYHKKKKHFDKWIKVNEFLYQIYKDAGDNTLDDAIDIITTKLDTTNSILKHRDITKEVHLGVSHAMADMLKLGGVKELLEKIAGEETND